MLKTKVNPNKAQSDIQNICPPKFNPWLASVACPIVVFEGIIYIKISIKQSNILLSSDVNKGTHSSMDLDSDIMFS